MDKFIQIRKKYKKQILLKDEKGEPLLIQHSNAFTFEEGNQFYEYFNNIDWKTQEVKIAGRWVKQARETFAYSKDGRTYTYSGLKITPQLYDDKINIIQQIPQNSTEFCKNLEIGQK